MTSRSASNLSPKDRAQFGAAIAKNSAFDAVYALWRRRRAEGNWTQKEAAESIGADEGWYSKQFTGPRNWTMESFGALVQSLNGEIEIIVHAMEDIISRSGNYDAYSEMDDLKPPQKPLGIDKKPDLETRGTKKIEFLPANG